MVRGTITFGAKTKGAGRKPEKSTPSPTITKSATLWHINNMVDYSVIIVYNLSIWYRR